MKRLTLLILFIFSSLALAQEKLLENKVIQARVMESSSHLKQTLTHEMIQSIGISEFTLKVDIKVNERKLKKTLGVSEQDWDKLQGMQLPGLFVEGKEGMGLSPLREARREDILLSLESIKVEMHYYQDNYTESFLTESLQKIITYNLPNMTKDQIQVRSIKEDAPYRNNIQTPGEILSQAFTKPLNVQLAGNFQGFWDRYHKLILITLSVIFIAAGLLLSNSLKSGLLSLAEVIKAKTFSISHVSGAQSNQPSIQERRTDKNYSEETSFASYIQANKYLKEMVEKEPKILNELVILKVLAEDFFSLTILMDVLPVEKRETFLNNIDPQKREHYRNFIATQGTALLQDENFLKKEAVKLIKLVKVAAISPTEIYPIVSKELIEQLSSMDIALLLGLANEKEKSYIFSQIEPVNLAMLLQQEIISTSELDLPEVLLTKNELIDLIIKASSLRQEEKIDLRQKKLESIYAQVEASKAELLADAIGLDPKCRFPYLFEINTSLALSYLESLDFSQLTLLYPLLPEAMKIEIMRGLPELLAERLKFSKKVINNDSLKIKGEFYYYLKSLPQHDENNSALSTAA
jgi:hypothetical protein